MKVEPENIEDDKKADQEHRQRIYNEAVKGFEKIGFGDRSTQIMKLIKAGRIPHVTINY